MPPLYVCRKNVLQSNLLLFVLLLTQHKNVNKVYTCHFKYFCLILTMRYPIETYQTLLVRKILISMKHISL